MRTAALVAGLLLAVPLEAAALTCTQANYDHYVFLCGKPADQEACAKGVAALSADCNAEAAEAGKEAPGALGSGDPARIKKSLERTKAVQVLVTNMVPIDQAGGEHLEIFEQRMFRNMILGGYVKNLTAETERLAQQLDSQEVVSGEHDEKERQKSSKKERRADPSEVTQEIVKTRQDEAYLTQEGAGAPKPLVALRRRPGSPRGPARSY